MKLTEDIARQAHQLLTQTNQFQIPINLESIAQHLAATIHFEHLDDEVSGMLVIKNGAKHIVINREHRRSRQRFTIAHELGHLVLHSSKADKVFLDTKLTVYHRSGKPNSYTHPNSTTTLEQEREANIFAASILMPEDMLIRFIDSEGINSFDEFDITRLAYAFDVSEQAISIRLSGLKLVENSF